MATAEAITTAILTEVAALEIGTPNVKFAMPNVKFEREVDSERRLVTYVQVDLLFNAPRWEGVGASKIDQGLLQLTVICAPGVGIVAPQRIASSLAAAFPNGHKFGGTAKVSGHPWVSSAINDAAETRTPVTIPWTA